MRGEEREQAFANPFLGIPAQGVGRSLDIPSQREVIKLLLNPSAAGMFCRILENTGNHKLRLIQPQ